MSDVPGHHITGGVERGGIWLSCSCGRWGTEELYQTNAPFDSRDHVVAAMSRLADAGRDHIVEVTRAGAQEGQPRFHPTGLIAAPIERAQCVAECNWLQTRQHAEGCQQ